MASQVLSGSSNVSYTNNTGQNVRIVINYMEALPSSSNNTTLVGMSWAGVSLSRPNVRAIGRNLAYVFSIPGFGDSGNSAAVSNAYAFQGGSGPFPSTFMEPLPTELMLAPGQTFAVTGIRAYNIVVIPEAG